MGIGRNLMVVHIVVLLATLGCTISPAIPDEFAVGKEVVFMTRHRSDGSDLGIPLHATPGTSAVSDTRPSGSTAIIIALGDAMHATWIQVRTESVEGWVKKTYVDEVHAMTGGMGTTPVTSYVVGCWNLEWFKAGKSRGFPEDGNGGPHLSARTDAQVAMIADVIATSLGAQLLVLNEINGTSGTDPDGDQIQVSPELDGLVSQLPAGWKYVIASSGEQQRVALLFNAQSVRVNEIVEFTVPPRRIQSKDIFERDPLAAHVTFLQAGVPRNDLVIVGLHLASGQDNNRNHDEAMQELQLRLNDAQAHGQLGGTQEHDVLLMGDLNANMFSPPAEHFFVDMDEVDGPWDVLASDGYPPTRLSGVPLALNSSRIDYIIASRVNEMRHGLVGDEVIDTSATVNTPLIQQHGGADSYRRDLSDHVPVTISVRVIQDND